MATKTKEKPAKTTLSKVERENGKAAYTSGREARDGSKPRESPFKQGHLQDEWFRGWDEADATEKSVDDANRMPNITETAQNITESSDSITQTANGHDFKDPDVVVSQVNLADLMDAFDNSGVSIEETQWRALSDEQQHIAAKWVNGRRVGAKSPCPEFLFPFATDQLKNEFAIYSDEQRIARRVIMPCKFGKHSETKPDGDDSEPKIKMSLLVPVADLSAATANDLWGWKRCRIEFGLRPVNTWDQVEIPGTEQTTSCLADVSGFSRNRTHWKFGFFINMSLLSIEDAYRLWKESGSCRVEAVGEPIEPSKRDESENPENEDSDDDEPEEVSKGPTLFDGEDDGEETDEPTQYLVPISHEGASCALYAWRVNKRFHVSSDLVFTDGAGETQDIGEGEMHVPFGDGAVSLKDAIEKELGSLIDDAADDGCPEAVINQLKDELNRISKGGAPHPMPVPKSEMSDASY